MPLVSERRFSAVSDRLTNVASAENLSRSVGKTDPLHPAKEVLMISVAIASKHKE